eukprot:TRINITY_DN28_c1_g1_i1.p3 TRINITY_DN28_c1_g1~~TRINITY_DN28_c1_g1_i1.p3  ORF type:complete len:155 (-),score=9.17 TRINITY_DN28_c1_g1_i1:282-746(-)
MPQYCGCATTKNKIRWAVFGALMVSGACFVAGMYGYRASELNEYEDCINNLYEQDKITEQEKDLALNYVWNIFGGYYQNKNWYYNQDMHDCAERTNAKGYATYIFILLWICCFIGASIPLYIMCCCTERPQILPIEDEDKMSYIALTPTKIDVI